MLSQLEISSMPEESVVASRIVNGVLLKTFVEILVVCGLVGFAAYRNLHPRVRGAVDVASIDRVAGWAFDPDSASDQLEVHLYIDDAFVATQTANLERNDLTAQGAANDPNHGFIFSSLEISTGEHSAQVYAVRKSFRGQRLLLPLASNPIRFSSR